MKQTEIISSPTQLLFYLRLWRSIGFSCRIIIIFFSYKIHNLAETSFWWKWKVLHKARQFNWHFVECIACFPSCKYTPRTHRSHEPRAKTNFFLCHRLKFDANRFLHRQFLMRSVFYLFKLECMSCRSNEFYDIWKLFFNFISSILLMNCIKSNSLSTIRFDMKRNAQKVLCIASPATTHRSERSLLTFWNFRSLQPLIETVDAIFHWWVWLH